MVHRIILFIFIIGICYSCRHESDLTLEKYRSRDIIIQTGTICGWCSVNDTLTLQSNSFRYVNFAQCSTSPTSELTGDIDTSEMASLLAMLNLNELRKLEMNSCNVCFDGCDEWILYKNGTDTHYIRFSSDDPKLQPIKAFVDQLDLIKARYSGNK